MILQQHFVGLHQLRFLSITFYNGMYSVLCKGSKRQHTTLGVRKARIDSTTTGKSISDVH